MGELERVSDGAGAGLAQEVEKALLATEIDGQEPFIIKKLHITSGDGEVH